MTDKQIMISNRRQGKNIYTLINELDQLKETNEELKNIIILTEMKAENYQRQMQGLSIAYDDFSNIIQTADEIAERLRAKC